ncbi:NarL family transcriptional regulator [bacterium CG10_46_32]|nr:MAG: NarL family transcriptional regulator [bacterium CG10_46_32]PIR56377.1 MAG: NarL family transcriptional regulator [Parcubacteria group bacterium CG10_big_fil_rev_8_21_14_0_10_46_32]
MRVPYALAVFGKEEREAVQKVLSTPMIVPGPYARTFEQKISHLFKKRYGVLVNSGSSANLLAFEILDLPKGSEVITPVLTFSTTLAPIIQKGLVPVFVDVVLGEYTIDIKQVEALITKKTKALMIPSLIGNIPDYRALSRLAKKYKLYLIEDSCDTLGSRIYGKPTGCYTDISTTSFYASHIITAAGNGGMICVNNPEWHRRAKMLAGWGRSSAIHESEKAEYRFGVAVDGIPYDRKFLFTEIGYNFQSTDIAAAFGLAQLTKFKDFFRARELNFRALANFFKAYEQFFVLPHQNKNVITAWLAFPLVVRPNAPFTRQVLVKFLEESNIQTRPMFTGNVLRQSAFKKIKARRRAGGYPNADLVMRGSLLIGCHQGIKREHLTYMKNIFTEFLSNYK